MTPERWQQIKNIFQAATEQETGGRIEFLDEACAGDAELRREVELLLLADQETTNPLDAPIGQIASALMPAEKGAAMIGQHIGVYRITGLIGQGGMGAVYSAVRDDDQYRQKVAIKLVKAELTGGGHGAESVLQRFRRERQILARLEHPNIARLLDGGTTPEGWPYLVMEFIEGQPLTEYCNARGLGIAERLELFRAVCAAVQHAHQNLTIHRDLKPSNILVTASLHGKSGASQTGVVKLLDFGIAKLLNPELVTDGGFVDLAKTATAMRVMTPDYASPEQTRGEAVTTATDIYSLGVVLYELLTAARPHHFTGHSFAEIERAICDTEPERPSIAARQNTTSLKLSKQLEGDLDNIILMALRKEAARRYKSVEQFAEDIRRHLDGMPVIARQDTVRYRAGKFARRHRWGVLASTLIALLLIGGTAFSTYQARRAERRFQQVRKLANTFLFEFDDKIANITGTTEARELLVKTALGYLDNLAQEAGNDAELKYELATAYSKVGDVQGNTRRNNLGHFNEALASYRKALSLAESLTARSPQNVKYQRLLASAHFVIGHIQQHLGAYADSLASYQRGVTIIEPVTARPGVTVDDLTQLMNGYRFMGELELEYVPDIAAGVRHERQSMEIAERRVREFPTNRARAELGGRHIGLAYALLQLGDPQTAKAESEAGIAVLKPLVAQFPNESYYWRVLHIAYQHLGMAEGQPFSVNLNDTATALQTFAKMQAITQQLITADAKDQSSRDNLAVGLILIGETEAVNEPARGSATLRQALDELRALAAKGSDPFRYRLLQTEALIWLADAENRQGNHANALKHLREAQAIRQTLATEQPNDFSVKSQNCDLQQILTETLGALGDFEGALTALRAALIFAESERTAKPDDVRALWRLADCYQKFGQYYEASVRRFKQSAEQQDAWKQAGEWYQKSLTLWDEWPKRAISSVFNTSRRERVAQAVAQCEAAKRR